MSMQQLANVQTDDWTNGIVGCLDDHRCDEHTDDDVWIFQVFENLFGRNHVFFFTGTNFHGRKQTQQEDENKMIPVMKR